MTSTGPVMAGDGITLQFFSKLVDPSLRVPGIRVAGARPRATRGMPQLAAPSRFGPTLALRSSLYRFLAALLPHFTPLLPLFLHPCT